METQNQPQQFVVYSQPQNQQQPQQQFVVYQDAPKPQQIIIPVQPQTVANNNDETISLVLFVLGFFNTICWLIGWIIYRKSTNSRAQTFATLSAWFFWVTTITSLLIVFFFFVFIFGIPFIFSILSRN
jgi:hypothetical protein